MKKMLSFLISLTLSLSAFAAGDKALDALMDRLSPGLSNKITVSLTPDSDDFFTIVPTDNGPRITANNRVSAAMGLNFYLKNVAHVQPAWDCMTVELPETLPEPDSIITRKCRQPLRYYLNYCTLSYSMPFWDTERWQREIDWMALHGINAALAPTGSEAVWEATLERLGYPAEKIYSFIASPAYQAWWLMNNLEGEGRAKGPEQTRRQAALQRDIIGMMRSLDIEPVFPGYAGMVPHDAMEELGLQVADPGKWCGYNRPAFLLPTDTAFAKVAKTYYDEQTRLFGHARFYSMDPFHEGGNTENVDLGAAAKAIAEAMEQASPGAVWLIQGWQENPRREILEAIPSNRLTVLDLHAETRPQWDGRGHGGHPWVWCMLLNFGGNEGLHGKLDHVASDFQRARQSENPPAGLGLTMEGIENNPVMFELACDMPWEPAAIDSRAWLKSYLTARYGTVPDSTLRAWTLLANSIYGAGADNRQQGTTESVFCARPSDSPKDVSAWANSEPYYRPEDVMQAAALLAHDSEKLGHNPHYLHDLVDITRQAVAEAGRLEAKRFALAAEQGNKAAYEASAKRFIDLILLQDSLLETMPHFTVSNWIGQARNAGAAPEMADAMEVDARTLVTTWGSRKASDEGQLHDYAHREWAGLLRDFYAPRWQLWFDVRLANWDSPTMPEIDFFEMEHKWASETGGYAARQPRFTPVSAAKAAIDKIFFSQNYANTEKF